MTAEQANRARERKARAALEEQEWDAANDDGNYAVLPYRTSDRPRRRGDVDNHKTYGLAMGVFSIGLGLAEILAPRPMARLLGMRPAAKTSTTLRLFGLREIAAGIGMIARPRHQAWAWARVAGDMLDVAALTRASRHPGNNRARLAAMTAATLAVTVVDLARAQQLGPRRKPRTKERDRQSDARTYVAEPAAEEQRELVVARAADTVSEQGHVHASTATQRAADDDYNNELANERSTF